MGKEAASLGVVDDALPDGDRAGPTPCRCDRRGASTPPPTAPELPIVAPVERTATPALLDLELMEATPPPSRPAPAGGGRLGLFLVFVLIVGAGAGAGLWWARHRLDRGLGGGGRDARPARGAVAP